MEPALLNAVPGPLWGIQPGWSGFNRGEFCLRRKRHKLAAIKVEGATKKIKINE